MSYTAGQLAALVEAQLVGDSATPVSDVMPLHLAQPGHMTFVSDSKRIRELSECQASVVILASSLAEDIPENGRTSAWILCDDPLAAALKIAGKLHPRRTPAACRDDQSVFIHPTAVIGRDSLVMPGASISEDVVIGDRCTVYPGVYIGPGCHLGDDVVLHPGVVLYDGVQLHDRVIIHASSVIGADGFGYRVINGRHERLPHFGTVVIEEDVEVGACSTIDRAMLGATRIGRGTKLDNLVMVAHNCQLGEHNIMVSQVGLAGSVTTGQYVVCAGQVGIGDHVHLGDHSVYGAKTGVHKDMAGHTTYLGAPAEPEGEAMRNFMAVRKLPAMRQKMREMERQLEQMQDALRKLQITDSSSNAA